MGVTPVGSGSGHATALAAPAAPITFRLNVNGTAHTVTAAPDTPLLYVLRDELQLRGPRFGCGLGQCGACTVLLAGSGLRSCSVPVSGVGDRPITTLEGLGTLDHPHPVQQAFIAEQAMQCGYCINGWIMTSAELLAKNPNPSDGEIRSALSGLICRCGAHMAILRAVKRAAGAGARG
jgi:nicotinate dehydrogenase subunit A